MYCTEYTVQLNMIQHAHFYNILTVFLFPQIIIVDEVIVRIYVPVVDYALFLSIIPGDHFTVRKPIITDVMCVRQYTL